MCPSGTKWDQKKLQSSFFSPSLLLQEDVESPAPAGPFLPWNTFSTILHREKNAGFMFFASPDLCEHRSQQQLRSGQGGAQFTAWNTTQHQQSRDGNTDPRQAGKRAVRKMSWNSLKSCCIYLVESTIASPSGNMNFPALLSVPARILGPFFGEASPLSSHWPSTQSCLIPEEHPEEGPGFLRKFGGRG